jgi:hypothetical protein
MKSAKRPGTIGGGDTVGSAKGHGRLLAIAHNPWHVSVRVQFSKSIYCLTITVHILSILGGQWLKFTSADGRNKKLELKTGGTVDRSRHTT